MLSVNFKRRRTAVASRGFLATGRLSCSITFAVLSIFPSINCNFIRYYFTHLLLVHRSQHRNSNGWVSSEIRQKNKRAYTDTLSVAHSWRYRPWIRCKILRSLKECAKFSIPGYNYNLGDVYIVIYRIQIWSRDLDHAHLRDSPYMHFVALVYSKLCAKFDRYSVNAEK